MKYNTKRARKAKRKAAALAKEQQSERKIELIPGIILQNIQLPQGSKQFLRDYYTKHPGEEPKLPEITEKDRAKAVKKGRLIVDTGWEEMKITTVELPDEIKREWKTYYISKLLRDETAEVVKSNIPTLLGAKRIAMELQRNDPNETYVIYEAHNKRQDTATLEPKIAVTPHGVVDGTKLADTKTKAKNHKQEKKQKQEQANE